MRSRWCSTMVARSSMSLMRSVSARGTLGNGVRLEKIERGDRAGLTRDDRAEIVELSKENARLRMERDLLKRATAFWVKESGQ